MIAPDKPSLMFASKVKKTSFWRNIPTFMYVLFCIVVLVLLGITAIHKNITDKLNHADAQIFTAVASQEQAVLNRYIQSTVTALTSITKTLLTLEDDPKGTLAFLENVKKTLNFESIVFADTHGRGLAASGQKVNMLTDPIFAQVMKGRIAVTDVLPKGAVGYESFTVAVPVRKGGRIKGAVIITFSMKYLRELLIAYTDNSEAAYIVDGRGVVIASSSDVYGSLHFLRNARFANGESYESFMQNALKTRWGGTTFTLADAKRSIEYRPLHINSWTLFFVSHNLLENPVRGISNQVQIMMAAMLFVFLFFASYIMYLKRKTLKEVEKIAFYDDVTGLANMVKFKQDVEGVITKFPNRKYVMQKVDIENFKAINEIYDYETGNAVLKNMAEALLCMKDDSFLCARMGADAFIMFSAYGFLDDDSVRTDFETQCKSRMPQMASYEFCFRYGRYFIEKGERDVPEMIDRTTLAHSLAKGLGHKNTWDYNEDFRLTIRQHTEYMNLSKGALENKEFIVYLQPKYSLKEQKVIGAEALVRWVMEDGSLLLPDNFIPVFEQNNFVVHIDYYVLRTVCARIKSWIEKGHKILPISVNFSRVHFKNPNFVQEIRDICNEYGTVAPYIEIEFTETALTEAIKGVDIFLRQLHEAGFSIAIDDFGAGYSSLGILKGFEVDVLKLDQSFFVNTQNDVRGSLVVNGISAIAHDLGMKVVAEGVELSEQFASLEVGPLEFVQGFFIAHPMPMDEFEKKYYV